MSAWTGTGHVAAYANASGLCRNSNLPLPFFRDLGLRCAYIPVTMNTIQAIRDDFAFLDEWEDKYRYVIDLGEALPPFPEDARDAAHKVQGCVSQVWLVSDRGKGPDPC